MMIKSLVCISHLERDAIERRLVVIDGLRRHRRWKQMLRDTYPDKEYQCTKTVGQDSRTPHEVSLLWMM
jgi:hypothetical protein